MNLFYRRPLLLAMTCFLALCAVLAFATHSIRFLSTVIFTVLCMLFAVLALFLSVQKHRWAHTVFTLFLCILFCCLASISSHAFLDKKLAALENHTNPVTIVAEVRECTYSASYLEVYAVSVRSMEGRKASFNAAVSLAEPVGLDIGNVIEATVLFAPFEGMQNGYNERATNISNGILVSGEVLEFEIVKEETGSAWIYFAKLRKAISQRLDQSGADSAPMLKALLLGDRSELDDSTALHFRRLGISHILSISGTHFTTLLGMALFLLSSFRVNKRVSYALMIPLALFYMALTGFSPSVCRAGIMAMLAYIGLLSGRMRDSYTALFAAVTVILLVQPYTVYSIGLWLSFTATFAILILLELLRILEKATKAVWWKKLLYYVFSRVLITIFVSFTTLPIIAFTFKEISLFAPIGNLLIVPLLEWFLYLAPFTVVFANFTPIVLITDSLYDFTVRAVDALCSIDGLLISLRPMFVTYIAVTGCIATLILLALPLKKRWRILLPSGICILLISVSIGIFMHWHATITDITYFTYKENDGIVLTDRNRSLLIDISDGSSTPAYTGAYIAEKNYSVELAGVLFTHYHSKHAATLRKLARSVNIQAIYLPFTKNEGARNSMLSLEEVAKDCDIPIVWIEYNAPFFFAGSKVTVYEPQYLSRSTHPVISLAISAKETDILYLGSSFNDAKLDLSSEAKAAEYVIYGQHHPKVKNAYSVDTKAFPIYGDSERYAFSKDKREGHVIDKEEDIYTLTLK